MVEITRRLLGDKDEATTISQFNLLRTLVALKTPRESVLEFVTQIEWLFKPWEKLSDNQIIIRDRVRELFEQF